MTAAKNFFEKHKTLALVLGIAVLLVLPQLTRSNYIRGVQARIKVKATLARGLNNNN